LGGGGGGGAQLAPGQVGLDLEWADSNGFLLDLELECLQISLRDDIASN